MRPARYTEGNMKLHTTYTKNNKAEPFAHQVVPIVTDRVDDMLDIFYESLDTSGWYATDHRDDTGEMLIEATRGNEYWSARVVNEEGD
jgi:hypothetical protein